MNERIKELAEQAGFYKSSARMFWYGEDDIVERFADLVRQDEREQAAQSDKLLIDLIQEQRAEIDRLRAAQPEQEPVAWKKSYDIVCALLRQAHDILATTQYPIKREWVGLTEEEVASFENAGVWGEKDIRAIEAKLKEKNGGT